MPPTWLSSVSLIGRSLMVVMCGLGSLNHLCCSNTNSSLMHMFSLSGLVPKLPDDLEGISPIAGLGNGGKYTEWAFS